MALFPEKVSAQVDNEVVLCFWSRIFVLFEPCVRFHIFSLDRVTEWPPMRE